MSSGTPTGRPRRIARLRRLGSERGVPVAQTPPNSRRTPAVLVVVTLLVVAAGCGGGDTPPPGLSAEAAIGWEVAREAGCVACHGDRGEGTLGPAWIGLVGSTVTLEDGRQVVADTAYLRRSILDPEADVVDGFAIAMPKAELDDDQVDALVAYIESLG